MRKTNIPLIIGGVILILILTVMLVPDWFTNKSPYNVDQIRFIYENGEREIARSPYPPQPDFVLGSDYMGRDILSQIAYGTRLTILLGVLVALGRFLIAIPISLTAGFGNDLSKSVIKQSNIIFSAIPALLISVIILRLDFFFGLSKVYSILAFVVLLSFVGWPKLGTLLTERVEAINKQPFIKGEIAIGKRRVKIALENVFPHLAPEMIVLFFMEIARTLSMIMQLGIFSVFVGNLKIIKDTEGGVSFYNYSFEPEWASMLSTSRNMISIAPYAVLFPALAFFISVLGFNLFGEGLRHAMQKTNANVIPAFRKMMGLNIKGLWKDYGKTSKILTISLIVILLIGLIVPPLVEKKTYEMEIADIPELKAEYAVIGSEKQSETIRYIEQEMTRLGLEPLRDDDFKMTYPIGDGCLIQDYSVNLSLDTETISPEIIQDFNFVTAGDIDVKGSLINASMDDLLNITDFSRYNDQFVLIDQSLYDDISMAYIVNNISNNASIKGILLVSDDDMLARNDIPNYSDSFAVLEISRSLAGKIEQAKNVSISVDIEVIRLDNMGTNLIGIHKGSDALMAEEAVMIGMPYNYLDDTGKEIVSFCLELMERLCNQYENKRSIIFVFLDGTYSDMYHGVYALADDFPFSAAKVEAYLDLTGIQANQFDYIEFSSAQAPFTRQYAWSMSHHIEKELDEAKIPINQLETVFYDGEYIFSEHPQDNTVFWDIGIASIILRTDERDSGTYSLEKLGSILLEVINKNNY